MRQLNRFVALSMLAFAQACSDDSDDDGPGQEGSPATMSIDASTGTSTLDGGPPSAGDAALDAKVDLQNVGTGPLDYANPDLWACRPDQGDSSACRANLDATEILKDGSQRVVPHVPATDPKFDCFYIYPTVATAGGGNMTNFADRGPVLDPLLSQAARFNRACEVYAPLYRQVSLTTNDGGAPMRQGEPALAVGDVLASFDEYIRTWNKGRSFVILGHSQGTAMAIELLRRRIDGDDALRARFISAAILGGAPRVPEGQDVGGSFKNIPACKTAGQTGCVLAYASYAAEKAPADVQNPLFGKNAPAPTPETPIPGRVMCTEPAALAGNTGNLAGSYFRLKDPNNPGFRMEGFTPKDAKTPFMLYRDFFKGSCVQRGEFNYFEVSINKTPDDKREVPPYRNPRLEGGGWGLHLVDWNLALDDIITAVEKQAAAKLAQ